MATKSKYNKYSSENQESKKNSKQQFKYIPAVPESPMDEKYHTLNDDGTYTYHTNCKLIKSIDELKEFAKLCKDKVIACDTETTGLTYFQDYIVGFSIALDDYSGIYIPIRHQIRKEISREKVKVLDEDGNFVYTPTGRHSYKTEIKYEYTDNEKNLHGKEALDIFYQILLDAKLTIWHNAEFDLIMLKSEGYETSNIKFFDTQTLCYAVDAESMSIGLGALKGKGKKKGAIEHYLGRHRPDFMDTLGSEENFRYLDPDDCYMYAALDGADTFALYNKLRPMVRNLLDKYKDTIVLDGEKYDIIRKDNKLIKTWIEYYAHTKLYIDKEAARKYKEKVLEELVGLTKEIYEYFGIGIFNLSTSSKQFKEAMASKHIVTGHFTDTGAISFGKKDGTRIFTRNIKNLEVIVDNFNSIGFVNSEIDTRANLNSLTLSRIIEIYGKQYFNFYKGNNSRRVLSKGGKLLSRQEFLEELRKMLKNEKEKLAVLKKIQKNNSLNKAVNSYIDKLTEVDSCKLRYSYLRTKSGRLSSGNGSKGNKRKNKYYIDLNAQNLTKPDSLLYKAYKSNEEGNILGWKFEPITDEYANENKEKEYIVEGSDPNYNIRDCIISGEGKLVLEMDYDSQEYLVTALIGEDSRQIQNFKDGIDPHTALAYDLFGKQNYNKSVRKRAKTINFFINYGGGAYSLAEALEISVDEAKEILRKYEETYFECMQWKRNEVSKMYKNGGVVFTEFGRPRRLGSYILMAENAKNNEMDEIKGEKICNAILSAANRRVVSHKIQGFCGDVCRRVLINLYDNIFKLPEREKECSFLSTVHDSFAFYVDEDKVVSYAKELEDLMIFKIPEWPLPIKVSMSVGNRLGSTIDFVWEDDKRTQLIPKRVK